MSLDKLVLLRAFCNEYTPGKAVFDHELLRIELESAGIQVFIEDQNINIVNPVMGLAGGGIKLKVKEADLERAIAIASEFEKPIQPKKEVPKSPRLKWVTFGLTLIVSAGFIGGMYWDGIVDLIPGIIGTILILLILWPLAYQFILSVFYAENNPVRKEEPGPGTRDGNQYE